MRKTKKMSFGGFYIFHGKACANSCFIENRNNAKQFVSYMNYYFRGYLKVYEYFLCKDGWELAVKLGNKADVLVKAGLDDIRPELSEDDICWKIISERVRLFLSTFVRVSNKSRGRTGTLVHNSYERSYFETLGEAISRLNDMRQQRISYYVEGSKYAGLEEHYEMDDKCGKGIVFLSLKAGFRKRLRGENLLEVIDFKLITKLVLYNSIKYTLSNHKSRPSTNKNSISVKI